MQNFDQFLLDNSPDAVCYGEIIIDEKARVVDYLYDYVNLQYARLTGLDSTAVKNQSMKMIFHRIDYHEIFKTLQLFINTGENTFEIYLKTLQKHLKIQHKRPDENHICTWITDMTPGKLLIQTTDEIIQGTDVSYRELTHRTLILSGASYGALNIYEEHSDYFHTVALAGANEKIIQAAKMLGFSLENKRWKEDPILEKRTDLQTLTCFNTCFDLVAKKLPTLIVQKIESLFKLGMAYVCKIQKDHQTIGNFILIFEKGKQLKNKNDLITYSQQIALRIIKNRMDEKYNSIINYSNDAIYLHGFDEDGMPGFFTEVNQKACDELGYTHEELLKLKIEDIDPSVFTMEKKAVVSELFEKKFIQFETKHYRKDGTAYNVEINTGLMHDNGREFAISIARNIEERKKSDEKLKLYKKIISTISDSMTFINLDMRFMIVNEAFAEVYNTTPSKIEGRRVDEIMGIHYYETTIKPNILKVLNGEKTQYETWFKGPDQKERYINIRWYPYFDETGSVIGFISHGRDMTLEKDMKDEIIRNHEVLNKIIELIPGTITLINEDYEILLTSGKNEKLVLTDLPSSNDFLGKKCYKLFHNQNEPCPWCSSGKIFKNGETIYEETTPDDPREIKTGRSYRIFNAPVHDENGKITGCLEYVQNITKNRKAIRAIEEALKNKTEALSTISHEIRNQLGGILGFSELIQHEGFNEETKDYLDQIITSSNNLMKILEDTLMMSKFESGNIQLDLQERDLSALLEKTYENMQQQALKKENKLYLTIPELPTKVLVDDVRLNQVLINLLSNANKFTEKGKINITVEKLYESAQTVRLQFSIADTGIGIPENMQQNIFREYDQGVLKANSGYGGTGIGLTISNKLLALMDSKLALQSQEGKGSVFSFVIDLDKVYTPPVSAKQKLLSHFTVLIADDHDISRMLAETMIRIHSPEAKIYLVENGEDALSFYNSHKPDFILLDIQMPKINGLKVTKKIRDLETQKHSDKKTIIVGYSAALDEQQIQMALETGMNDFIQKPIMNHVLYDCLERYGF